MHRLQPFTEETGDAPRLVERRGRAGGDAEDRAIDAEKQKLEQTPALPTLFQFRLQPHRQLFRQAENIVFALDRFAETALH
ncbi:hypothetical protein D3C72_2218110 [compost metagenome]